MSIAKLLNRPLTDELLHERSASVSESDRPYDSERRSLTIFRFSEEFFALGSEFVSKIIPIPKLHPIPHRLSSDTSALFSVDGAVYVCVDLRRIITGKRSIYSQLTSKGNIVVVKNKSLFSGFAVDEVCNIQRVSVNKLAGLPATSVSLENLTAVGIFEWDGKLVSLLDGKSTMKVIGGSFQ